MSRPDYVDRRGSSRNRAARRLYLLETYRADVDVVLDDDGEVFMSVPRDTGVKACRCYRCGDLLTLDTLTVDRIKVGDKGGTYARPNIRPACHSCNSTEGNLYRWYRGQKVGTK